MGFNCIECFDTQTIDFQGREIACPFCSSVTVKITGLGWGLGETGNQYRTAVSFTKSTITFKGSEGEILRDVATVRQAMETMAKLEGRKGRNSISSGAIAVEKRVRAAIKAL